MIFSNHWFRLGWLVLLMLCAALAVQRFKVESSILKLLPKYESAQTNALIDKATELVNKQVVLLATAKNKEQLIAVLSEQLQSLAQQPLFKTVDYRSDVQWAQEIYQSLRPHQYNLLSPDDQLAFQQGHSADYFVLQAKEYLYGVQQLSHDQMATDPLFLLQRLMASLSQLNVMSFDVTESFFLVETSDGFHAAAFIELADSAFLPQNQHQVVQTLDRLEDTLQAAQIELVWFGAVKYAHQAYQNARQEISTVGLGSLVGIVLLLLWVFRSVIPLLLSISSIALGLVVAFAVTVQVFGEVHVFALVFGATIAGVSIDYCFHYLVDAAWSEAPEAAEQKRFSVEKIIPALFIGFMSSALVYSGFLVTGYEVLGQIALFSVVGLLSVLLNVLVFYPWLYRVKAFNNHALMLRISNSFLHNPVQVIFRKPLACLLLLCLVLLADFYLIEPNDDVRALQQLSEAIQQEESHVRGVLDWQPSEYYILISDEDIDSLLQQEADMLMFLRKQDIELVGISDYIPTATQQEQHHKLQQHVYQSDAFDAYLAELELPPFDEITFEAFDPQVLIAQLSQVFKQRWLGTINGQHALIIPLYEQVSLPDDSSAVLIQQAEDTSKLFGQFRTKSSWMLAIAVLLLVGALSTFRYSFVEAAHMVSVPLLSGFSALALASLLGYHVSLFSVLALLLVLGMGLDYVVFLRESKQPAHVMLALLLSSLTTMLAFGLLAFSQVAVLKSFGFMVGVGIAMVLLFSPAVTVWQKK